MIYAFCVASSLQRSCDGPIHFQGVLPNIKRPVVLELFLGLNRLWEDGLEVEVQPYHS
jgi:hypothetical protein